MKKIKNFMLPEHTNTLFESEALSSLHLTKDVADKINELIEAYNEFSKIDLEWKQTQEGKINAGVLYMKDNIINSLNDLMCMLKESGFIDNRIEYHCDYLKERLDNLIGKVVEGSTTLDAEVIDLRVGVDGRNYKTGGEALRTNLLELLEILDHVNAVEWSEHPNPKIIVTDTLLRFTPKSRVELLDKNYNYIIDGYDDSMTHIFTSLTFNESKHMNEAVLSERVKYVVIKLFRKDNKDILLDECNVIKTYLLFPEVVRLDKTLLLKNTPPDSKVVGDMIQEGYLNLLHHTVKDSITWNKTLEYRFETNMVLFNKKSKIELQNNNYMYAIKGFDGNLEFIYDSGWIKEIGIKSVFDYIKSERIKYLQILLQTRDSSTIDNYNYIDLIEIYEPLTIQSKDNEESTFDSLSLNSNIKVINHRGFNFNAPENTMPAFKLAVEKGYRYIETDVQFTSDNVPVLIHDETIDRTSNGTGSVNSFTYNQLLTYDFGSWFKDSFSGVKIPTLDEFLKLCKYTGVHPYIELKYGGMTNENIIKVVNMIKKYGMIDNTTIVSSEIEFLQIVKSSCDSVRLGLTCQEIKTDVISNVNSLKTDKNEVFIDVYTYSYTQDDVDLCIENDIPLELWVVNGPSAIPLINPYVTGVTTDNYNVHQVLYDSVMG